MAGGEYQLWVVVADRLLDRFFRSCGQMLSAIARIIMMVMAHIRTGSHTEFVILRGDIQFSRSLLNFFSVAHEGLNCYLGCGRDFLSLHSIGLENLHFTTSTQKFSDFFNLFCDVLL